MTNQCILVVDDDPFMRAFAEAVLSAADFDVVTAASAAEGVARFAAKRPDLIILDYAMPGMGGAGPSTRWRQQLNCRP